MKKILMLITIFTLFSCSSDDNENSSPIPTGSDTVSFTYNDKKFSSVNNDTTLEKVHVYADLSGALIVFKLFNNIEAIELSIGSGIELQEGKTYAINGRQTTNLLGQITYYHFNSATKWAYSNNEIGGSITIVKLDYENQIIAATFNYDAVEENGTIHTIRNGWFDLKF